MRLHQNCSFPGNHWEGNNGRILNTNNSNTSVGLYILKNSNSEVQQTKSLGVVIIRGSQGLNFFNRNAILNTYFVVRHLLWQFHQWFHLLFSCSCWLTTWWSQAWTHSQQSCMTASNTSQMASSDTLRSTQKFSSSSLRMVVAVCLGPTDSTTLSCDPRLQELTF